MTIKNFGFYISAAVMMLLTSCYEQELKPVAEENFPLKIVLDATEGGAYESDDSYDLEIGFDGGVDEITNENGNIIAGSPQGTRGPFSQDIIVEFELKDLEGLSLGDVTIDEVIYEIDDCTDGEAAFTFNENAGTGTFTLPAGVEIVEIVFALNDATLNNSEIDDDGRAFVMELTGIQNANGKVILDINNKFEYHVLDDEDIFTEWVLDHENPDMLEAFLTLFSEINEELEGLTAEDIGKIKFEFKYEEVTIVIELNETELVEECGEEEEVNLEIELEGEFEVEGGEIEIVMENEDGDEFTFAGEYEVTQGSPNSLAITLEGEDEDGEIFAPETSLTLERDE